MEPDGVAGPALLYLSRADLLSLGIGMAEVMQAVEAGCRARGLGETVMPPKLTLRGEDDGFSQVMPASLPGLRGLGMKWVTLAPANVGRGLPLIHGLVFLSDAETGVPCAVMDGGVVTAWRTGASVGVAARHLASPATACAGLLGCGVQGRAAVRALAAALPALRTLRCFDVHPAAARSLAAEIGAELPLLEVVACGAPRDVVAGAGVVVSAITMVEGVAPPLGAGLLEPGALAVALDYDAAWTAAAMAECDRFFCDDSEQVLATRATGVRLAGIPSRIAGDLGELAAGRVAGRRDDDERLFCMNLGMAIEDVVTAQLALARAREAGVGRELPL